MLLGGKAVLTMRGVSALTSSQVPGVATLELAVGGIKAACDADPGGIVSRFTMLVGQVEIAMRDATGQVASPFVSLGKLDTIAISRCAPPGAPSPLADVPAETLHAPSVPPPPPRPLPRLHP